ncbi:MAG: YHS domain-containing protein [Acidobacteriota bacterium]
MKKSFVIMLLSILIVGTTSAQSPQSQERKPPTAIEGLDPVMLVQGKDVIGQQKYSVIRGDFEYLFASEENKAAFEKDPARYEIQLDGTCARMGPAVAGNADLFTVYKGRIYIFGSGQCLKLFEAAPEKYLEKETAPATPTAESLQKGTALIAKAVQAMGGAEKIDALAGYIEKRTGTVTRQNAQVEVKIIVTKLFPDRVRQDRAIAGNSFAQVLRPGEMFVIVQQQRVFPGREPARAELERSFRRTPLEILRARRRADFKAYATGQGKAGESVVDVIAVEFGGVRAQIGIDATGRILSLSYRGRNSSGEVGETTETYSDFRAVSGLTLPYKITGGFNAEHVPESSFTVDEIQINPPVDPALFDKPTTKQ